MWCELDFEHAGHGEAAAFAVHSDLNRHELRVEDVAHRRGEDREASAAARAPIGDLCQRCALLRASPLVDINAHRSATLVNSARPRCCVDEVETVEPHSAIASVTDVVGDQRLASPAGRPAAEVAGAAELAIAGFEVVRLNIPPRNRRHADLPGAVTLARPIIPA